MTHYRKHIENIEASSTISFTAEPNVEALEYIVLAYFFYDDDGTIVQETKKQTCFES